MFSLSESSDRKTETLRVRVEEELLSELKGIAEILQVDISDLIRGSAWAMIFLFRNVKYHELSVKEIGGWEKLKRLVKLTVKHPIIFGDLLSTNLVMLQTVLDGGRVDSKPLEDLSRQIAARYRSVK